MPSVFVKANHKRSVNRTKVELKFGLAGLLVHTVDAVNRTKVELKWNAAMRLGVSISTVNRTKVELKFKQIRL